jgi:hypothetical protein
MVEYIMYSYIDECICICICIYCSVALLLLYHHIHPQLCIYTYTCRPTRCLASNLVPESSTHTSPRSSTGTTRGGECRQACSQMHAIHASIHAYIHTYIHTYAYIYLRISISLALLCFASYLLHGLYGLWCAAGHRPCDWPRRSSTASRNT